MFSTCQKLNNKTEKRAKYCADSKDIPPPETENRDAMSSGHLL